MGRFALAWEQGGGMGHAATLAQLARVLLQHGHEVDLIWRDLAAVKPCLGDLLDAPGLRTWLAPSWHGSTDGPGMPTGARTYGELLCFCGYLDARFMHSHLQAWLALLQQLEPDVLVIDHAPTALLAAKGMPHMRTAQVGNGYFQPPTANPFPNFCFWDTRPIDLDLEATLLMHCRAAQQACGIAPLASLGDLLQTDMDALLTWPELHHYGHQASARQTFTGPLPPPLVSRTGMWPGDDQPRCLAYVKASHPGIEPILSVLIAARLPTLLVLPGAQPRHLTQLAGHAHIRTVQEPIDMGKAIAQASVVVCQGNSGTVFSALSRGKPLLLLPAHVEQWLIAYRTCELHAGIALQAHEIADEGVQALQALIHDPHFRTHAQAISQRHTADDAQENLNRLSNRLMALV